ncbi:restriction endonuclease subunit S [Halomonas sp. AOP42-B2-16]|uniref:restriction endonuclease subunit S n=1 Tax=Halomonas sp. AOP42-B2-16 TaxID=3457673 RepID=UPI0040340770
MNEAALPDGWDRKPIKAIAKITTGDKDTKDRVDNGIYPFFVRSQTVERINSIGFDGEGVLTAGDGVGTGKIFHYINGKCDFHQRVYLMHSFTEGVTGRFFFHYFSYFFYDRIMAMTAKSSVDSVRREMIADMEILFPRDDHEQERIAAALSDADGVVAGLERVIAKKRLIKQGAMQDLLTARRRLPGFSGEWEVKPFGQIAKIRNTKVQTMGNPVAQHCIELEQVEHETGRILFWVDASNRSTVKYQFEAGDVLFGRLRPYLRKFHRAASQGVCSTEIWPLMSHVLDRGFLYQVVQSDGFIAAACEAYGTHMPRADWGKLSTYGVQVPIDLNEQAAIGEVLSDMEKEIQTLESRLTKARVVKEGMMQNLLTGRVRLV